MSAKHAPAPLKAGDKVLYHDIPATVRAVRSNGVIVDYWITLAGGQELNRVERVSARYLRAAG